MATSNIKILADAPGVCCTKGIKHSGTPVGYTQMIGDIETYVSESRGTPSGESKVILFLADVFGPLYTNNQLLQDCFASNGFTVIGPDYLFGDPIQLHLTEADFDFSSWIEAKRIRSDAAFPRWLEGVKEKYGTSRTKYCAVGYCYGAPYTLDLGATDFISAAAIAHPAFLQENHFRNLKAPLLLSCAEIDEHFPLASRRRAEDILNELNAEYYIQVFGRVKHGFAVRGNPEVLRERWAKEESARGMVNFFQTYT